MERIGLVPLIGAGAGLVPLIGAGAVVHGTHFSCPQISKVELIGATTPSHIVLFH